MFRLIELFDFGETGNPETTAIHNLQYHSMGVFPEDMHDGRFRKPYGDLGTQLLLHTTRSFVFDRLLWLLHGWSIVLA